MNGEEISRAYDNPIQKIFNMKCIIKQDKYQAKKIFYGLNLFRLLEKLLRPWKKITGEAVKMTIDIIDTLIHLSNIVTHTI